jgi:hypothetical protein
VRRSYGEKVVEAMGSRNREVYVPGKKFVEKGRGEGAVGTVDERWRT